jgi:hypothetical protein
MNHARDDVLAAARAAFQAGELTPVLAALDLYGAESYEPERERVQLAIIELSKGSYDKLVRYVEVAKSDYRDVLAWKALGPLSEAEGMKLQDSARALIEKWGKK